MPITTSATDRTESEVDGSVRASQHPSSPRQSSPEPGVVDSIRHLAEAGKALAAAEVDRAKVKASYLLAAGQRIALLAVIALVVGIALVVTLLVGLMLCLEPLIGIGFALLVTVAVAVAILGMLALGILTQIRRMKAMPS